MKYKIKGTLRITYYADVDDVAEAQDKEEATKKVRENVLEELNYYPDEHEWQAEPSIVDVI